MYIKIYVNIIVCCLIRIKPLANYARLPTNNDPYNQIRFETIKEAEERRYELIWFIWNEGLPTDIVPNEISNVSSKALDYQLKYVNKKLVKSIDRLEVELLGLASIAYSIIPAKSLDIPGSVLFSAGHGSLEDCYLKKKYCSAIEFFHEKYLLND